MYTSTLYSLGLGPAPSMESCLQVGHASPADIRKEALRYRELLHRHCAPILADLGDAFSLRVESHPHDFGPYVEVTAVVDGENRRAVSLASYLETDAPSTWEELEAAEPISEVPLAACAA